MIAFADFGYLGKGYNLVTGNPQPFTGSDPGRSVHPVFDMSDVSKGSIYPGSTCLQPNAADVGSTGICSYKGTFSEVGDAASLQRSLKLDISMHAHTSSFFGIGGASFTASGDYQTASQNTQYSNNVVTSVATPTHM